MKRNTPQPHQRLVLPRKAQPPKRLERPGRTVAERLRYGGSVAGRPVTAGPDVVVHMDQVAHDPSALARDLAEAGWTPTGDEAPVETVGLGMHWTNEP